MVAAASAAGKRERKQVERLVQAPAPEIVKRPKAPKAKKAPPAKAAKKEKGERCAVTPAFVEFL